MQDAESPSRYVRAFKCTEKWSGSNTERCIAIMIRSKWQKSLCLLLLPGVAFMRPGLAHTANDFAGYWVLTVGNRPLIVVTLRPGSGGAEPWAGWLASPKRFESGGTGDSFSNVGGPSTRSPVIRSRVNGQCLLFTTHSPTDKHDQQKYRLCLTAPGHATLGIDIPGAPRIPSWPVAREEAAVTVATDWNSNRTYFLGQSDVSNAEMGQIYDADQKDRRPGIGKIDWAVVSRRDAERRKLVRELLSGGKLHTGKDFERAAFVFQHGDTSNDYLLAHTLAIVATARGDGSAIWIAAATLDRYLQSIHQPQIYGTQFKFKTAGHVTQKPYDRHLISDALRRDLDVPSLAAQRSQRKTYEEQIHEHR